MEPFFTKIAAWLGMIFPAASGSALSVYLNDIRNLSKVDKLNKVQILCSFIFGLNVGYFVGTAANEYFDLDPASYVAGFILFTSGLMGMAIIAEVMVQMPAIVTAIRKKWLGE